MLRYVCGGGGDGGGGGGDGGDGGDGGVKVPGGEGGGTGQVVWQTYFNVLAQDMSFHLPGPSEFNSRQSATMIHTSLPAAAATSSAFCAAD